MTRVPPLAATEQLIERPERIELSTRNSLLVLDLLDNPPEPSAKLCAAARRHREIFGR